MPSPGDLTVLVDEEHALAPVGAFSAGERVVLYSGDVARSASNPPPSGQAVLLADEATAQFTPTDTARTPDDFTLSAGESKSFDPMEKGTWKYDMRFTAIDSGGVSNNQVHASPIWQDADNKYFQNQDPDTFAENFGGLAKDIGGSRTNLIARDDSGDTNWHTFEITHDPDTDKWAVWFDDVKQGEATDAVGITANEIRFEAQTDLPGEAEFRNIEFDPADTTI